MFSFTFHSSATRLRKSTTYGLHLHITFGRSSFPPFTHWCASDLQLQSCVSVSKNCFSIGGIYRNEPRKIKTYHYPNGLWPRNLSSYSKGLYQLVWKSCSPLVFKHIILTRNDHFRFSERTALPIRDHSIQEACAGVRGNAVISRLHGDSVSVVISISLEVTAVCLQIMRSFVQSDF